MSHLSDIKSKVRNLKGKEVVIETRESRGRIETFKGTIQGIYPAFFNIQSMRSKQQLSFNYVDILTNEIVLHTPDKKTIHGPNPQLNITQEPNLEVDALSLEILADTELEELMTTPS